MTRFQKKFLMRMAAWGLVIGVFFFVFFVPKYLTAQGLRGRTTAMFHENQRVGQIILASRNPGKRFAEIQQELDRLHKHVPGQDGLLTLLEDLPSWAEQSALKVLSVAPDRDEPYLLDDNAVTGEDAYEVRELVIEMKLKGAYFALTSYLWELQRSPYRIRVRKLSLNNSSATFEEKKESEPDLLVDLELGVLMRFLPKGGA